VADALNQHPPIFETYGRIPLSFFGLFGGKGEGHDLEDLARRLDVSTSELADLVINYTEALIPKRSGGTRRLLIPAAPLKKLQRLINRRLLNRLKSHPAATGFERGHSIVTNAAYHRGRPVVVSMDVKNFFPSTSAKRIKQYFLLIGWNKEVANLLTKICTHEKGLPQGAPTSPRLSNLVNYPLDSAVSAYAAKCGIAYTRYADDLTFSFPIDDAGLIANVIGMAKVNLDEFGYTAHQRKKLRIRRRHQRQIVTGLVVNERVQLPRETRRWLRAVRHRRETGGPPTLTDSQLAGWTGLTFMIETQRDQLDG